MAGYSLRSGTMNSQRVTLVKEPQDRARGADSVQLARRASHSVKAPTEIADVHTIIAAAIKLKVNAGVVGLPVLAINAGCHAGLKQVVHLAPLSEIRQSIRLEWLQETRPQGNILFGGSLGKNRYLWLKSRLSGDAGKITYSLPLSTQYTIPGRGLSRGIL